MLTNIMLTMGLTLGTNDFKILAQRPLDVFIGALAVLPCAISCAWHSISGTILAGIYLKWDHMHGRE